MRILKTCFIPLVFILVNSCTQPSIESKPYNVLFLIVDDMNDYGFYNNYEPAKTPYLDSFKESALTFRQAYCASPVCTPSRAATFSGLYPHASGAYFNGCDPWRTSDTLKKIQTLPECFRENGYKIYGRGKLYHAKLEKEREKTQWDNKYYGGGFGPFADSAHMLKGKFWGVQAYPDSVFPDVINCDNAIKYLQKEHDKPFFMALGLWRPHTPFTAPQRFFDMFDINDITIPDGYKENDLGDISPIAKQLVDPFKRFVVSGADNPDEWKKFILGYNATTAFA
ncbi:MAG: sulfatase-like hydrolase/transferase, partial [Bacteroidales bacterium]|nr:sulfatase-like hydrolase/transferase [Bacteroidales bacterium]